MIGYLQGTVIRSAPDRLVVDVGGVGYLVHIPLSTYYEVERLQGDGSVQLHIHTHVRADGLDLFGFWTEQEKLLFEKLIGVSGIGPRLAQVVLSGMPPSDLVAALAEGDAPRLTRIPGVGKKTADRMVVELQEAAQAMAAEEPQPPRPPLDDDLVLALVNLGYKRSQAERAVAEARRETPDAAFHELLRSSLKRLSRL